MEAIDYKKETILIVDDDAYLRDTLEKLLQVLGFPTQNASNATDALELIKKDSSFTILLTDMKMPGMPGMELIEKVSSEYDVSIIAMTGFSEGYKYVDVINAGASDFIKKPFGIEELEAKLRRIITERNLKRELNRLSITDSLTQLFNQRHFYIRLQEEVTRAKRQKHPLSLILLDLDDFKKYNDRFGHLAGDDILRKAGQIILNYIREGVDTGYRYGGDEFAVILIEAEMNEAKEIGERIKKAFKGYNTVSVSVGYAKYAEDMTVKDFVSTADKSLYSDKSEKNKDT